MSQVRSQYTKRRVKHLASQYVGHGYSAYILARRAYQAVQYIRSQLNVEWKTHDVENASTTVSTTATLANIALPAEGLDYNQRTGRSVLSKSIYLHLRVTQNGGASQTAFRCILLIDYRNDGAVPAFADIYDISATPGYLAVRTIDSENARRYGILYDRIIDLDTAKERAVSFEIYKRLRHHQRFIGTGSAAVDQGNGAIYIIFVSNEATNTPTVTYTSRYRFIDN